MNAQSPKAAHVAHTDDTGQDFKLSQKFFFFSFETISVDYEQVCLTISIAFREFEWTSHQRKRPPIYYLIDTFQIYLFKIRFE